MQRGYFRLGRLFGIQLRWHWTVPLGALVLTRLRFEPAIWLAYLLVIIVHELGHAALVRRAGLNVVGIDLTGFGGECRYRGHADRLTHSWIAWGGVLAQLGLLALALGARAAFGAPASAWASGMLYGLVELNLWIVVLNLLPIPPLDGAEAWRLFSELRSHGWTMRRALFAPLQRWAGQRRQRRRESESAPAASSRRDGGRVSKAHSEGPEAENEAVPSEQARRELAALLERVADEAAKARRRR